MRFIPLRILLTLILPLAQQAWCEPAAALPGASPDVNQPFQGTKLGHWESIFERPGREVYDQRYRILEAAGVKPGLRVADIGAGSGLFSSLFAHAVGPQGRVYAVEVSPGFVAALEERARSEGLGNLGPILSTQRDTGLDPGSIDLAFVCDTYHHFEEPKAMLESIHRALDPGGVLILIDYHRRPGFSSPWILSHVRAGRDQVVREVESAGFRLTKEPPLLRESYFLRFERLGGRTP
jgi:predicted methyltransferase